MNKMIFDGQVFQSDAWDRGMGKYSLCLLSAIASSTKHDMRIIFSDSLPLPDEARAAIENAAPKAKIDFLHLEVPDPRILGKVDIAAMGVKNARILDEYIDETFPSEAVDFIILSLFIDRACSVFPTKARKILLFYDLIPLQYSERYGRFEAFKTNYLARFKMILDADLIWTISQTVADDLVSYLGLNAQKIHNINGAPIQRKHQTPKKPSMSIPKRYLIMPSGNDIRKNNLRAVQGFEEYRQKYNDDNLHLIITSFFDDTTRKELSQYSPNLIFSGNIPEAELKWLYQNATALLFMSEYEGLGLPILEAVEENKPVICSNLTVFNEMSESAFYYADQLDPVSISEAIHGALNDAAWAKKQREYPAILGKYTWAQTAKDALEFLANAVPLERVEKRRLAVFAPNPSGYSAIGKVVMQLHPALSEYFTIDYYIEDKRSTNTFSRPSYLPAIANVYKAGQFTAKSYEQYDAVLYHVGNSEYHLETIKNALYLPGFSIMHDTDLTGVYGELKKYGYLHASRVEVEKKLDALLNTKRTAFLSSLVNAQRGVITHSEYAKSAIEEVMMVKDVPVRKLNLPTGTPSMKKLKIDGRFSIGFAGIIHEIKGLQLVDEIINDREFADARIYIFGVPLVSQEVLERLKSHDNITLATNVTDFEFQNNLANLDVLVNYRNEYHGETSLSCIEAMRMGVVPFVRNVGWFGELPDNVCIKIDDEKQVTKELKKLKNAPHKVVEMSTSARELMKREFSYEKYARELYETISRTKQGVNDEISDLLVNGDSRSAVESLVTELF
jgi:glycosyltransferase involved in cell wall biosynthesis